MTRAIREIRLGPAGLDYVRECLADGKELSQNLLQSLDLERGNVTTFLPIETPEEEAYQFRFGGKVPQIDSGSPVPQGQREHQMSPTPNMITVLTDLVEAYLKTANQASCVVEDPLTAPGDAALRNAPVTPWVCGQSVFYVLKAVDADRRSIEAMLRAASSISPPTVGALARWRVGEGVPISGVMDIQEIREFAMHTEKIFVGAYDGEGFLIWSKAG